MEKAKASSVGIAFFALFIFFTEISVAQTNYYTWKNTTNAWSTSTAWDPAGGPQSASATFNTNVAIFSSVGTGNNTVLLGSDRTVFGLIFTNGANAYTLGSVFTPRALNIMSSMGLTNNSSTNQNFNLIVENVGGNGIWSTAAGATTTFNNGLNLTTAASTANRTLTLGGAGTWNVASTIANGGTATAGAVTVTATGITTFSGNNTYDGRTTLNAVGGTLTLSGNNSGATGGVTLTAGTLNINNNNALGSGALSLGGTNTTINNTSGSAVVNAGNQAWAWTDGLAFGSSTNTAANNLNLGTGVVTASSSRTIALAGTGTKLTMGSVNITSASSGRTITANGAGNTIEMGGLTLSGNTFSAVTVTLAGTANIEVTGAIVNGQSFANGVTITSTGTTTFSGTNTYSGQTKVMQGTLVVGASGSLSTSSGITVSNGATLRFEANSGGINLGPLTVVGTLEQNLITIASSGTVDLTGSTLKVNETPTLASYTLVTGSSLTGIPTLSPAIPGYQLLNNGTGSLLLTILAPTEFSYSSPAINGTVGTVIPSLNPTVTGSGITYSISPALPLGLSINPTTGVIGGTPLTGAESAIYTVTASNVGGSTSTNLTIAVALDSARDQDGDGVLDSREIADGTNPNDANSYNSLNKGLVAYYPFNGNANDESGNGRNATISGAALAADRLGKTNQSYFFNNTNYVSAPVSNDIVKTNFTISIWVKVDSLTSQYPTFVAGLTNNFVFQYANTSSPPGVGSYYLDRGATSPYPIGYVGTTLGSYSLWNHFVIAGSSGTETRMYLNGNLVSTTTHPVPAGITGTEYRLGSGRDNEITFFYGKLDDIRFYNRTLSATEISQLYQQEAGSLDTDGDGLTDAWELGYGRYQIITGNFTWPQAKVDAEARGGHLGTITSEAEWGLIRASLEASFQGFSRVWLGGSDMDQEGIWKWTTGEAFIYQRWASSPWQTEPHDGTSANYLDWMESYKDYTWNDETNTDANSTYLLEFGYPTDPTKADTDGDGFNDKLESDLKTDPNNGVNYPDWNFVHSYQGVNQSSALDYVYENNNIHTAFQQNDGYTIQTDFFSPYQSHSNSNLIGRGQGEYAASLTYKYSFTSPIQAAHLSANISIGFAYYGEVSRTGSSSLWVSKDGANWTPILQPTSDPYRGAYQLSHYNDQLPPSVLGGTSLYLQYRGTATGLDATLSRFSVSNYTIGSGYGTSNTYEMKILTENLAPTGQITLVPATEGAVPVKVADLVLSDEDLPNLVTTITSGFEVRGTGANREIWTTGATDYETDPNLSFVVSMVDVAGATGSLTGNVLLLDNPSEDTDGDGVLDSREIADGTNPNDASSYNNLNKGLVAYYPFNGNANDESGNGNHATNQGAVLTNDRLGIANRAYTFNGSNAYLTAPHQSYLNTLPLSISCWFRTSGTSPSSNKTVSWVDWTNITDTGISGVQTVTGQITVGGKAVQVTYTGETGPAPQIGGGTDFWIEDKFADKPYTSSEAPNRPSGTDIIRTTSSQTRMNRIQFSVPVQNPVIAINSLGAEASTTVVWSFNTDFEILSWGRGYWNAYSSGELSRLAPAVLSAQEGHGVIRFQGLVTEISWTSSTPENWHGFTVGLQEYMNQAEVGLLGKYDAADSDGYQMVIQGDGTLWPWYALDRGRDVIGRYEIDGDNNPPFQSPPINNGQWHHAVFAVNSTNGGALYIDGELIATKAWRGTPNSVTSSLPLMIGKYAGVSSGDGCFSGEIDEVRIYNRLLSLQEIVEMVGNVLPPQITSTNSFSGTEGVAFSNTVTASGSAPIVFSASNLPSGLSIATNGLINGTPTIAGTNITVFTASNSFGVASQTNTFVIAPSTPPTILSLRVRAHIDGPSQLILSPEGIRWHSWEWTAVPGRHEGRNDPTYLNDEAWFPIWPQEGENRGYDAYSSYFTAFNVTPFLSSQTVTLSTSRARDTVVVTRQASGELLLTILNYDDMGWGGSDDYDVTISVSSMDTQGPAITLTGADPMEIYKDSTFNDPGATVTDNKDATRSITGSGTVNTGTVGIYTLTYTATDVAGNMAVPVTRTVNVVLDHAADEDGDGLSNGTEISGGTNPYQRDSDNDGVTDPKELADGTNPNDASSYNTLNKGLVAYYPFNGNANDESGNGNHGFPEGATLTTDRYGNSGKAFLFNGLLSPESNIKIPTQGLNITTQRTLSAWVKYSGGQQHPRIFSTSGWEVGINPDGANPRIFLNKSASTEVDTLYSSEVPILGRFVQIVAVFSDVGMSAYVDGTLVGYKSWNSASVSDFSRGFIPEIGGNSGAISDAFGGTIDDVRIYNRALSSVEVGQLYQKEVGTLDTDGDGLTDAWERGYGRYQIVPGTFTWEQAKGDAEARGGHLATITSQAEWDFVESSLLLQPHSNLWMGGKEVANRWSWITGETWSFTKWWWSEPNAGADDVLFIPYSNLGAGNNWYDGLPIANDGGFTSRGYICESGYPTDPTKADTDGDGFNDSIESHYASDPNNASVTPNTIRPAGRVVAWGRNVDGLTNIPESAQNGVMAIAAGGDHALALKSDGSVVGWGNNNYGQINIPQSAQSGVTAIAAGYYHSLALKSDGSVVGWGGNTDGQINIPQSAQSGVTAIAAGSGHSLALKSDGSVVGWGEGWGEDGQSNIPQSAQSGLTAISGGHGYSLALKSDGSVVGWGYNGHGQINTPQSAQSGVTAIAAGGFHSLALKSNGSVVGWGWNDSGEINIPQSAQSGVTAIAAGYYHSLALKSDGSVVGWGRNIEGQVNIPQSAQSGVTAIAAGWYDSLALTTAPAEEPPTIGLTPNPISLIEGDSGRTVGTVTLADPDGAANDLIVTLGGFDASYFSISGTGATRDLITAVPTDYESGKTSFNLTLTVTDVQGLSATVNATASLLDDRTEDKDGDGLTEQQEEDTYGTSDLLADTDGDGVIDYREIADGTNPSNASSYNGLNKGLVAYYPFNGNANDESGLGNHGILAGAVLTSDQKGVLNSALQISQADGMKSQSNLGISGNSDFSVSFWMKPTQEPVWPTGFIIGWGGSEPGQISDFYYMPYHAGGNLVVDENYVSAEVSSVPRNLAGSWSQITYTYNSSSMTFAFFLNGVPQTEGYITDNLHLHNLVDSRLYVGGKIKTGDFPPDEYGGRGLTGVLDNIRIYNRALSASEVDQLYSAEAPPSVETFGSGANQFSIDFVRIGNPGNVADTTGSPNPAGSVAYNYNIGKYEISRDMINKANSAGTLGITMYDMTNYGGNGVNKPATGISWYQAARFVNWLNTSKGFVPAYKFDANGNFQLWSASDAGYDVNNLYRNSLAKFFIPSRSEWYKAAYGAPSGAWYDYPTGTDTPPVAVASGTNGNTVVYSQPTVNGPSDITNAGGLSAYGTMGQGANAIEWVETTYDSVNDTAIEAQELRGGAWDYDSHGISSSHRASSPPGYDNFFSFGFRVASSATVTNPTGVSPQFTSTNSFLGQVGVAFSNTVTASGTAPITFGGSNLPTGLNISTNGLISGTPTLAGTNNATLTASNAFGTTNQTATFVITKGTPVISNWPSASPISYGQALSNSVLSGGSANVPGAFAWVNPTDQPNSGTSSQSVSFTPTATSNYNSVTSNINVVVNKASPVLTWTPSPAASLTYPAPLTSTQLNATSSVAGTFSYNPASGTILNVGTNQLVGTFTPTDTANYSTAGTATNTVVVAKGSNGITFGSLPSKQLGEGSFSLTASASSGLPVSYTSANSSVATVSGSTVTIVGAGTTVITASQAGSSSWNAATDVTQTLTVLPRTVLLISGASVTGKIYDGSRTASVDWSRQTLVGAAGNHDVRLVTDSAVATYDSASAGVGKSVSVTGLSLSGADAGRYELGSVLLLSGAISKRQLTIENLMVTDKRYDGSSSAPLDWSNHTLSGYVNGETTNEVRLLQDSVSGYYANAQVGINKAVTLAGLSLSGSGKDNYTISAPANLTGTILKGWVEIGISNTNQVYGKTNRVVTTALNLSVPGLGVRTNYWGTNGTAYGPSSLGPTNAGSYGVEVVVEDNSQTYEGSSTAVLTIGKKSGVITAVSDTIRAGTVFSGTRYTGSGFLDGDTITGTLVTHLRSVTNTNPPVSYDPVQNESGVYRILRGNVGDNVSNNYTIDYREGTLTVLKASYLTEGSVMPLAAGLHYSLVVQNNGANNPTVRAFGSNSVVVSNLPTILTDGTAEVAGVGSGSAANFGMAWMRDGAAKVWGSQDQTFSNVVGMAGGAAFVGYLKENGTVGVWGSNAPTVPVVLTNSNTAGVLAIAAGQNYLLALRTNGSVTGWGTAAYGLTNPPIFSNAVVVAAGNYNGVVVKGDGTVATWGNNTFDGTNIPAQLTNRLTNTFVRAVSAVAGYQYTLVLRADGTVRGWGSGSPTNLPLSLSSTMVTNPIVSLALEQNHAVAMQRDGTVTTWLPTAGLSNTLTLTVPPGLKGRVPMGGADSDGDGWANEAELRVGSDPMSRTSQPVKASFGVTFSYGSVGSSFETSRTVSEGTNRLVGTLQILDTMGRLEDGNQTEMTVELSEESLKTFEPVSRTNRELRFKSDPVYDGVTSNNVYKVDVLVRDSSRSAVLSTTLDVEVSNTAPQITPGYFSVNENVPVGTALGMLQASESGVSWSITAGNGLELFAIDGQSGQIKTAGAIDYEALANKTITLGVAVTDVGGGSTTADVTITIVDVYEGMTFGRWLGGVPPTPELLVKYAIGGASSPTGSSESTITVLDGNKLTLTAVVRTDDPDLSILGEAGVDLSSWNSSGVSVVVSANQASVPEGCERRIYSVDRANSPSRQFLRLRVTR